MDRVFQIEPLEAFQNVSQQILANLYYSGSSSLPPYLEADAIALAKQELISIISHCDFDLHKIIDLFMSKGWLQEKVKCFQGIMESNKSEVLNAAFNYYNSSYCETVVNFDWLVKLVVGTSELKTLKYPLLQLMMSTLNKSGKPNKIMYDANKHTLSKMINVLESIK